MFGVSAFAGAVRAGATRPLPRRWAAGALAVCGVAFAVWYLHLMRRVGPTKDEWAWLLYLVHPGPGDVYPKPGASFWFTLIYPDNSQPIVGEVLIYKAWAELVGVGHYWVVRVFFLALQLSVVALVFCLARRRVGERAALAVGVLVLISGRAWETVLFPASMTFVLPALVLCAAWTALDRRKPSRGRLIAVTLALALVVVSTGLGVAILGGLAVEIIVSRRWWRLSIVVGGSATLFAWWLRWHSILQPGLRHNLPHLPLWGLKYLSAAAGATVGAGPVPGAALLVGTAGAICLWRRAQGLGLPRTDRFAGLVGTLLLAVGTTGAARAADTPASTSRYMYFSALVLLLLCSEATADLEPRPRSIGIVAPIAAMIAALGLGLPKLGDDMTAYYESSDRTKAVMGALLLTGTPPIENQAADGLVYGPLTLRHFVAVFGRSAFASPRAISQTLPAARLAVDKMLGPAELRPVPVGSVPGACRPLPAGGKLPRGSATVRITADAPVAVRIVRYATAVGAPPTAVRPPGTELAVSPDALGTSWRVVLPAAGGVGACAIAGA